MKYSVLSCIHSKSEFHDNLYRRCLESLKSQTFKDFDVIIVLDQCWEHTEAVVNEFKGFLDIRIIKNDHAIGHANAKNIAIPSLESDYVFFTDADDWSDEKRFEKQVDFLEKNTYIDSLACMVKVYHVNGDFSHDLYDFGQYETHEQIYNRIFTENMIAHGSLVIKTNLLKKMMYNKDIKYGEDWDLYKRSIANGYKFYILQDRLYNYTLGSTVAF